MAQEGHPPWISPLWSRSFNVPWVGSPSRQPLQLLARDKAAMQSAASLLTSSAAAEANIRCPRVARKDDAVQKMSMQMRNASTTSSGTMWEGNSHVDAVKPSEGNSRLNAVNPSTRRTPPSQEPSESTDDVRDVYQQRAGTAATQSSG